MKILLADDDPHLLDAITVGIELTWQHCTVLTADEGEAALLHFYEHAPDVVVLDVSLQPDRLRGLAGDPPPLQRAGAAVHRAGVRTWSRCGAWHSARTATWSSPAATWCCWPTSRPCCGERDLPLRSTSRPTSFPATSPCTSRTGTVARRGSALHLTPIEFQLLYLLVANAGDPAPQRRAGRAGLGMGADHRVLTSYLKAHVDRLRAKLELGDASARCIHSERGVGYRFVPPRALFIPPPAEAVC